MVRPRKIPGEKSVKATFSLSDVEYEAIKAHAAKEGVSASEWLRGTAIDNLPKPPPEESGGAAIPRPDDDT